MQRFSEIRIQAVIKLYYEFLIYNFKQLVWLRGKHRSQRTNCCYILENYFWDPKLFFLYPKSISGPILLYCIFILETIQLKLGKTQ